MAPNLNNLKVFGRDVVEGDPGDTLTGTGGPAGPEQIPPPAATFRTLRLVYVEVASSESSRALIGDLLQFIVREGLRADNRLRADSHYGYGVSGSTHYSAYHLPHDARKIEAWLAEHVAERVPMMVDGVEVTG